MKYLAIIASMILLSTFAVAIDQPSADDFFQVGSVTQPVAPSTGDSGQCTPWELRGETCQGNTRHYELCIKTASGGVWQPRSEVCDRDFPDNVCSQGECKKSSEVGSFLGLTNNQLLIIALVIIGFALLFRRKK